MNRLNKKYNSNQMVAMAKEGKIIVKPNYTWDTYGTNSSGLLVRKGITVTNIATQEKKDYQVVFSSRGSFGETITSDLVEYNGRFLDKHYIYKFQRAVNDWFNHFLSQL